MRLAGSGEGRGREGGEDCLGSQKPTTQGGEGARGRGGERGRGREARLESWKGLTVRTGSYAAWPFRLARARPNGRAA